MARKNLEIGTLCTVCVYLSGLDEARVRQEVMAV